MKNNISTCILLCFVFTSALITLAEATDSALQPDRIAIISAFGPELEKLKSQAVIEKERVINGKTFTLCEIEGRKGGSLSDLSGGGKGGNEMETLFKLAADYAAEVLLQFLKAWK